MTGVQPRPLRAIRFVVVASSIVQIVVCFVALTFVGLTLWSDNRRLDAIEARVDKAVP